jgi:Uma2 family endonuclease
MSSPAPFTATNCIILSGVTWTEYRRHLRAFAERPRVRLTYDRGVLEIMSPLSEHEIPAEAFARFLTILAEELKLPIRAGGSMTLRHRRRRRGLQPDKCWWIANVHRLRPGLHIDLRIDPPPDLVVEVDVTSSSIPRLPIYATLGVPEVWRVEEGVVSFLVIESTTNTYRVQAHSLAFPILASGELSLFLARVGQVDDTTLGLQFRAWVKELLRSQGESDQRSITPDEEPPTV